ncbi:hypothetical protein LINPERPRIM_LOCUS9829 [Linum perenne]
MQRGPYSS